MMSGQVLVVLKEAQHCAHNHAGHIHQDAQDFQIQKRGRTT